MRKEQRDEYRINPAQRAQDMLTVTLKIMKYTECDHSVYAVRGIIKKADWILKR